MLRHAGFESLRFVCGPGLSNNPLKRWARLALRRLQVEHVFLAATYVIFAERV
jgi:hypothetical protein